MYQTWLTRELSKLKSLGLQIPVTEASFLGTLKIADVPELSPEDGNWYFLSEVGNYANLGIVTDSLSSWYAIYDKASQSWLSKRYSSKTGTLQGTITKDSAKPTDPSDGDFWYIIPYQNGATVADQTNFILDNFKTWNGASEVSISISLGIGQQALQYKEGYYYLVVVNVTLSENKIWVGSIGNSPEEQELGNLISEDSPDISQMQPKYVEIAFNVGTSRGGVLDIPINRKVFLDAKNNPIDTLLTLCGVNAKKLYVKNIDLFSIAVTSVDITPIEFTIGSNANYDNLLTYAPVFTDVPTGKRVNIFNTETEHGIDISDFGLGLKLTKTADNWGLSQFVVKIEAYLV